MSRTLLLLTLASAGCAAGARAGPASVPDTLWPSGGAPVCRAAGPQFRPGLIPDGNLGAIVVWEDQRDSRDATTDLYAQHITADGSIAGGWPADGLAICTAPGSQLDPVLAPDGQGGAFIAWYDGRDNATTTNGGFGVYVQHVLTDGTIPPGWSVNGNRVTHLDSFQLHPVIAANGAQMPGGCYVAWEDDRPGTPGIYLQQFTWAGAPAPGWPADGLAVCTAPGEKGFPDLVADGGTAAAAAADPAAGSSPGVVGPNGCWIAWQDGRGPDYDIYAQRVTAGGAIAPGWPADGARVSTSATQQLYPHLLADGLGGAFLTWNDMSAFYTSLSDLYLQHVDRTGALAPGWSGAGVAVCTAPEAQYHAGLVPDGAGGAIAVWTDFRNLREQTFLQRVSASGAALWAPDGVPATASTATQGGTVVASDSLGGAYLGWIESTPDSIGRPSGSLRVQRFTAAGAPAAGWPAEGVAVCGAMLGQGETGMSSDGAGGVLVAWSDLRDAERADSEWDIYAARVQADGSVPAVPALIRAQVELGHVRLTWFDRALEMSGATVYRHGSEDDWAAVGSVNADGQGRMVYEDGTVLPGRRYTYRLVWLDGATVRSTAEASVVVPAPRTLDLESPRPNPAGGELSVRLTLTGWTPATLELCDLAGRRRIAVTVDSGPGTHTVSLGSATAFEPGVYFLRLTQSGASRTRRVTLLR